MRRFIIFLHILKTTIYNTVKDLKWILIAFFGLCLSITGYAQYVPYTHYSDVNDLPSAETYAILEDHNGYMWIGTDRGLVRFDGEVFDVFSKAEGLDENVIFDIFESNDHTLWVLGYGKVYFSKDHKHFYPYPFNHIINDVNRDNKDFFNIIKVAHDTVLLYTHKGLTLSITADGHHKTKQIDFKKNNQRLLDAITNFPHSSTDFFTSFPNFYQYYMTVSKYNIVQFNTSSDSLKKMAELCYDYHVFKTKSFLRYGNLNIDSIYHHFPASDGYIEVNHFKNTRHNYAYYTPFNTQQRFLLEPLNGKHIVGYVIDQQNGLWIATNKNGVYYFENLNLRKILPSIPITHLFKTHDETLIAHRGWEDKEVNFISSSPYGLLNISRGKEDINAITTNHQSVRYTSNGDVRLKNGFLGFRSIQKSDSILYTCGANYVWKYPFHSNVDRRIITSIKGGTIMSFYVNTEDDIWIGDLNGLYHYDGMSTEIHRFKNGVITDRIEGIKKDKTTNTFFIATIGGGLYHINKDRILQHFTETNSPLGSNDINQLYLEGDSTLWIGTTQGLNQLNLKTHPYQLKPPCILGESVSKKIHQIITDRHHLYFLTSNGLFQFNKSKYIDISAARTNLVLEEIRANGQKIAVRNNIKFSHEQNHIDIRFNAPVFGDILKARTYEYRFIGKNSVWQSTKNNQLSFSNLIPKKYQIEIRAMCFNREISRQRLLINFSIKPPFWETIWFLVMVMTLISLILIFIGKYLLEKEIKQNKVKRERIELKQKALRAQLNSHFIFNTLSAIQHSISVNPIPETKQQVENFATLLRNVLEKSDDSLIPIAEEIEIIKKYVKVENFRFQKNISIEVELADQNILNHLIPPLLLQPIIENAIQHGFLLKPNEAKNEIKIRFHKRNQILVVNVIDNGVGLNQSKALKKNKIIKKESRGLNLIKQRLESLHLTRHKTLEPVFEIIDLKKLNTHQSGTQVTLFIMLD